MHLLQSSGAFTAFLAKCETAYEHAQNAKRHYVSGLAVCMLLSYLLRPQSALKGEGRGDNSNSKDTQSLGSCSHYRCSSAACPATHACLQ